MNARRRLRLLFSYTAALLAGVAAVNWRVDPLGIWGYGVRSDATLARHLVPYAVVIDRPTTVILGNSRVAWSMQVGSRGTLNAGLPGARLDEMLALAEQALLKDSLQRLVIGADLTLFRPAHAGFAEPDERLRRRLRLDPLLLIPETLLNRRVLDLSLDALQRRWSASEAVEESAGVWSAARVRREIERTLEQPLIEETPLRRADQRRAAEGTYLRYAIGEAQLAKLRAILDAATRRNVEVILLVPSIGGEELAAIEKNGAWPHIQNLRRQLAAMHPYFDAAGYHFLAFENRLLIDPLHVRPVVGQVLLRVILGAGCDECGEVGARIAHTVVRVDASNVEAHLESQEQLRAEFHAAAAPGSAATTAH